MSGGSSYNIQLPTFKVVVVGDANAGKTTLLHRAASGAFAEHAPTIVVDFTLLTVRLDDGAEVRLQLWDTAGQERHATALSPAYLRNAAAVLYVYDADSRRSLDAVARWVRGCEREHGQAPVRFLIGTKCDLAGSERTFVDATALADSLAITRHVRCSAKTGDSVDDAFRTLGEQLRLLAVDAAISDADRRANAIDLRSTARTARAACQC